MAIHGYNQSFVWQIIMWGRDLLKKGLRWHIAKGSPLSMFNYPWMLRPMFFKPIIPQTQHNQHITAGDLMTSEGAWDWNKIHNTFWEVDSEEVKRLPIDMTIRGDKLIWYYSRTGENTVKTRDHLAQASEEATSYGNVCGLSQSLQQMWNLKSPNKIKIQHILFNALPVRLNLIKRGILVDISCPLCG